MALHGAVAAVLVTVDPLRFARREAAVEMDVVEPPPPPPPASVEEPPPPPPPPVRARVVVQRVITAPKDPTPPPETPPPPNQEPPPNTPPAPPVFGVTMDSTVTGNSSMAVPVGNTLATNDRTPAPPGPPPRPLPGGGAPVFTPVADIYLASRARVLHEENSPESYPADARRMGISGSVDLRLSIDENGDVKEAKVISVKPSGYQFDDAALKNIRKFKFAPARTSDGKAVPSRLPYKYTFTVPQ